MGSADVGPADAAPADVGAADVLVFGTETGVAPGSALATCGSMIRAVDTMVNVVATMICSRFRVAIPSLPRSEPSRTRTPQSHRDASSQHAATGRADRRRPRSEPKCQVPLDLGGGGAAQGRFEPAWVLHLHIWSAKRRSAQQQDLVGRPGMAQAPRVRHGPDDDEDQQAGGESDGGRGDTGGQTELGAYGAKGSSPGFG